MNLSPDMTEPFNPNTRNFTTLLMKKSTLDPLYSNPPSIVEFADIGMDYMPVIGLSREHAEWAGTKSVDWNENVIGSFDVVVATAHSCVDYQQLAGWSECIVDTRNSMAGITTGPGLVWKA
jgi:hypothetical protein